MRKSAIGASSSAGMKRSPVDFNSLLITSFYASFQPTWSFVGTYSKRRSPSILVRISTVYFERTSEVFSLVANRMTTAVVSALRAGGSCGKSVAAEDRALMAESCYNVNVTLQSFLKKRLCRKCKEEAKGKVASVAQA